MKTSAAELPGNFTALFRKDRMDADLQAEWPLGPPHPALQTDADRLIQSAQLGFQAQPNH